MATGFEAVAWAVQAARGQTYLFLSTLNSATPGRSSGTTAKMSPSKLRRSYHLCNSRQAGGEWQGSCGTGARGRRMGRLRSGVRTTPVNRRGPHDLPIGILPAFKTGGVVSVSLQRPIFPFGRLPAPLLASREVPSRRLGDAGVGFGARRAGGQRLACFLEARRAQVLRAELHPGRAGSALRLRNASIKGSGPQPVLRYE